MKEEGVFDVYLTSARLTKIVEIDRKNVTTWHKRYYKRTRHTIKILASATATRRGAVCQSLQTIFREESNRRGHHIKPKRARLINVTTILEVKACIYNSIFKETDGKTGDTFEILRMISKGKARL